MPDPTTIVHSEARPIIEAVERLTKAAATKTEPSLVPLPNGDTLLCWREGGELKERILPAVPPRPSGVLTVTTVDGFAGAVGKLERKRRAAGDPEPDVPLFLFRGDRIEAVLNHFTADRADYGDHLVAFKPPLAPEWLRWRQFCSGLHARGAAADYVEDNAAEFAPPAGGVTGDGTVDIGALKAWLAALSLKMVMQIHEGENDTSESVAQDGSATATIVTRLALRVHEGGDTIGFRCRWRARLKDKSLVVSAHLVNANEAERRLWLGPTPDGIQPLVVQVTQAIGVGVLV